MKTLILQSPGVVSDPEKFKKIGHSNFYYEADLLQINPNLPALMGFHSGQDKTRVSIDGATMFKVNNGVIDFANPSDGFLDWDVNLEGSVTIFAFVPTKKSGYIRYSNGGNGISNFLGVYTASDAIRVKIEPIELKNYRNIVYDFPVPGGYSPKFELIGDINGLSESTRAISISIPVQRTNFKNAYWEKPLPATFDSIYLYQSNFKADIDLSVFKNIPALLEIRVGNNIGIRFFGDINYSLQTVKQLIITDNYSQDGITGSLNSIGTNFEQIFITVPNLTGGYTSRDYPLIGINVRINAPKVPAADWDLFLSDLANRAPNLVSGYVQVNKRTAASDASVTALAGKGVTVVVGF